MASQASRRDFIKTSALAAGAASFGMANAHAAGDDLLKIGLIGCGGRGTGAAAQALQADPNVKLWAMADAFEDRLQFSLKTLSNDEKISKKIDVPRFRQFVGFDAYKEVLKSCDVVLLCTPPGFRPLHLRAAVEAGKHIFGEKPVAVDGPGIRSVLETIEMAKQKKLSLVSGLCLRYDQGFREAVARVHDGQLGDIAALQCNDLRSGVWVKPREQGQTDMEYQMRNWYYYTWLSGDFNVEQHVHYLDVCAWLMKNEYPVSCVGTGGVAQRSGPQYGQIFDHFAIIYEYANGSKCFSQCRHQRNCKGDMSSYVFGAKGNAVINESRITFNGPEKWSYRGKHKNMYQVEHDELFNSIRKGLALNNGEYMAKSSLMAIMGRMAGYTGQQITWEMALNSKEDLSPPKYDWQVSLPEPPVAIPGKTKFF
ncbi:MAG: Gfo/Idh/MocA family oxidoreductase [Gemmataceae bacterium]